MTRSPEELRWEGICPLFALFGLVQSTTIVRLALVANFLDESFQWVVRLSWDGGH